MTERSIYLFALRSYLLLFIIYLGLWSTYSTVSNLNFLFIPVALFMPWVYFHPGFLLIPETWVLVHLCILNFEPIHPCFFIYINILRSYLPLQPWVYGLLIYFELPIHPCCSIYGYTFSSWIPIDP